MAQEDVAALLGGWEGFEIAAVRRDAATRTQPVPRITIELRAVVGHPKRCSRCHRCVETVHDVTLRRVRDLPIADADTWLVVPRARVDCPYCGPTIEAVSWMDRYQRMTTRFADAIARLAQVLPIQHVAQWFRIAWSTVKQIDHRALAARFGTVDLSDVRVIALDEFALQRGHQYATVVVDPIRKRVLWVGRGRSHADVVPFFTLLGPAGCAQVEAAVMDMNGVYADAVRTHCPHAAIVYDLFHVVAKYGREVIDRVRVDETNRVARAGPRQADHTRAQRRVIKGTRWLLLQNAETITRTADRIRLEELLAANHALFTVYVLKDDLKQLWRYRAPWAARRAWEAWVTRAQASGLAPLQQFAHRLMRHLDGILSHCRYPFHTSLLEGINNTIKVLKRRAYGYRDDAYFFLKIRAAFPGIP